MSLVYNSSPYPTEYVSAALAWLKLGHRVALVTLINIEGSAPYPVGAQMLVNDQGEYLGQITGGCAEVAIAEQAGLAIRNKENLTHRYGLDSPFFDIQLPCGSGIDVFFDCDITEEKLSLIANQLEARTPYIQRLNTDLGVFQREYSPAIRLMLFGQGPILVFLAELALKSGFDVACIAQNAHTEELLEEAALTAIPLQSAINTFASELDRFVAIVSLFHEHEMETELLAKALKTDVFYIGALGSKRTHSARLDRLKDHGVADTHFDKIRGPVGLNIGASTPAQIAVSILAEVIEQLNSFN